jgi:hypothetical protein
MAEDYVADANDALAILNDFGMPGTAATLGPGGTATRVAGVPVPVTVVRTMAEASTLLKQAFTSGTVFIMGAIAPPPKADDELVVGAETWILTTVKTISPTLTPIVHLCAATRAQV